MLCYVDGSIVNRECTLLQIYRWILYEIGEIYSSKRKDGTELVYNS